MEFRFSNIKPYIFSIGHGLVFSLSLITDWYESLSVALFSLLLIEALDRLGKGIVLREMVAMFACFISLIMPIAGYRIYNHDNYEARLWVRYMPVPEQVYYTYALPAIALFTFVICFPILGRVTSDQGVVMKQNLELLKNRLRKTPRAGIGLVITGLIVFSFIDYLPVALQYVATLLYFSSFAGVLYIYFSPDFPYKKTILLLFAAFIFWNALREGMFTIVAYMGITLFSFFFIGRKAAFWKKLSFFLLGAFILLLVQSVKISYRRMTWLENYQGNRALLFTSLIWERLNNPDTYWSEDALFPIYYRTNQGYNVGLVMRRFPAMKPHDDGANLTRNFFSSLVPRFLWPDKPEAGGKFNMKYYAGITLRGWSTNVGPLGEGYGSFGVVGGIVFMGLLGFFVRWVYRRVFVISRKIPLLVCWIPVLFYQVTYSAEADTLQILNSVFKGAFYIWLMYLLFPSLFGKIKKKPGIYIKKMQAAGFGEGGLPAGS